MNTRILIASIVKTLKNLDRQQHYKIADKIFNNLRIAQEGNAQQVEPKTFEQILDELREYSATPEALKAGYKTLSLKYHPDLNNSDPIATENFKLLQQAYGRLKAGNYSKDKSNNQLLRNKPISNFYAEIRTESFDDGYTSHDNYDLEQDQIEHMYIDYLNYTKYWKTRGEKGSQPPVRMSLTEADLDEICEAIAENISEEEDNIIEVVIDLFYTDSDGIEKSVYQGFGYRAGLIEEYEERTKYLSGDDDEDDDDDDGIRRLN